MDTTATSAALPVRQLGIKNSPLPARQAGGGRSHRPPQPWQGNRSVLVRAGEVRRAMILIAARVMVGLGALDEALVHVMDLHKRVTERLRELPL